MNHQMLDTLKDAAVVAELAFLLHARLDAQSAETCDAVERLVLICGDMLECVGDDPAGLEMVSKSINAFAPATQQCILRLRHTYALAERMAEGTVANLEHPLTVVTFKNNTVFCHGSISKVVEVAGTTPSGGAVRMTQLVECGKSWVDLVRTVVPMYTQRGVLVEDIWGQV